MPLLLAAESSVTGIIVTNIRSLYPVFRTYEIPLVVQRHFDLGIKGGVGTGQQYLPGHFLSPLPVLNGHHMYQPRSLTMPKASPPSNSSKPEKFWPGTKGFLLFTAQDAADLTFFWAGKMNDALFHLCIHRRTVIFPFSSSRTASSGYVMP